MLVLASLVLGACNGSAGASEDARATREREQLARFPLGEIVEDGEEPTHDFRAFPPSLHMLGPVLGRGVCVALDVVRPDGARDMSRWGVWTYEYVRTDRRVSQEGQTLLVYGPIEETSTGLEAQGEFARDVPAGLWRFWYPDGQPRAEGSFNEGKPSGAWKYWQPDGKPDTQWSGFYRGGELAAQDARR